MIYGSSVVRSTRFSINGIYRSRFSLHPPMKCYVIAFFYSQIFRHVMVDSSDVAMLYVFQLRSTVMAIKIVAQVLY